MQEILAQFGLTAVNVVAGGIASLVALGFWHGLTTRKDQVLTFLGGWALAAWGAPPLREWLELKPTLEVGLVLILGLFGMALAAEVIHFIRGDIWKKLVLKLVSNRFGINGGKGDSE